MPRPLRFGGTALPRSQKGAALLLILLLVGLLVTIFAVLFVNDMVRQNLKHRRTAQALALAKEALIGYAVSGNFANNNFRPGDLPCPDLNDDGVGSGSCSNAGGTTLGRLPWKTLGLPDLRDGDGERLWYAVSENFKNNPRSDCDFPGQPTCLNSNTRGTITVYNRYGKPIHDATMPTQTGAIAVIIAPGAVLRRSDAASEQDRSSAGVNAAVNYLDTSGTEDNTDFVDNTSNGFIAGPLYDAAGNLIVNDTILPITYEDLMPLLEKRVIAEAMACITAYGAANKRYPWAAGIKETASATAYEPTPGLRFGRIPDTFSLSLVQQIEVLDPDKAKALSDICEEPEKECATPNWSSAPTCRITTGKWWMNWKDQVFYATAAANQPDVLVDEENGSFEIPPEDSCTPATCLTLNPAGTDNIRAVVLLAGRSLPGLGQPLERDPGEKGHYLEGFNFMVPEDTPSTFWHQAPTTTFNDIILAR